MRAVGQLLSSSIILNCLCDLKMAHFHTNKWLSVIWERLHTCKLSDRNPWLMHLFYKESHTRVQHKCPILTNEYFLPQPNLVIRHQDSLEFRPPVTFFSFEKDFFVWTRTSLTIFSCKSFNFHIGVNVDLKCFYKWMKVKIKVVKRSMSVSAIFSVTSTSFLAKSEYWNRGRLLRLLNTL